MASTTTSKSRSLAFPSPKILLVVAGLLAIVGGILLRASHTTDRPLHTDEAVQAWQTWQLLDGQGYRYDPVDMHGPTLYHGAAWWTRLTGGTAATFDDLRARSFSLLAGALTLLLFWRWSAVNIGAGAALAVAVLLSVLPVAVVYNTYFIQEPWLALGSWALLFAAMRWWREPSFPVAVACGILAGLVQATKETSVIHFAAIVPALFALGGPRPNLRQFAGHAGAALAAAAIVFVAFYSGFGAHPGGIIDGLTTYKHQFTRSDDGAFAQPFFHYFAMLLPHKSGGVRWGETMLLLCSAGGFILALRRAAPAPVRSAAVFTLVLLLLYSAIPYKMPWLLLTPALGFAVVSGFAISQLAHVPRWGLVAALSLTAIVAIELGFRAENALGRFAGDARNPYFLEQTPRGFTRLTDKLDHLFATEPNARVAVVSPNHAWPLPWYLRNRKTVGYFETLPDNPAAWDVRIIDSQLDVPAAWTNDAVVEIHGLRPNVVLTLAISRALWDRAYP